MCPPSEPPAAESPTPDNEPKRPNPPPVRPKPPAVKPEDVPPPPAAKESAKIVSVLKPVRKPAEPTPVPVPAPTPAPKAIAAAAEPEQPGKRLHPIPPPSDPMQYRAIGLVRGRYVPSAERLTKGMLVVENGVEIDSVLLGRVMSLVKNHIDLEKDHLWVVYPRTRENHLHLQVVGVWEPETLHRPPAKGEAEPLEPAVVEEEFFSIRGEVMSQRIDQEAVVLRIQQSPRRPDEKAKAFKIHLKGVLGDRAVGYFWDVRVKREADVLTIVQGTSIAVIPPKKRKKPAFDNKRGGPRRFNRGDRPGGDRSDRGEHRSEHRCDRGDRPPTPRPQRKPDGKVPKPRPRTAPPES